MFCAVYEPTQFVECIVQSVEYVTHSRNLLNAEHSGTGNHYTFPNTAVPTQNTLLSCPHSILLSPLHSVTPTPFYCLHSILTLHPQEQGKQVERLVTSAPRQEAEITGFKSDLTKKTVSLSAVWGKFAARLREREKALRLAASFYNKVTRVSIHIQCVGFVQ